MALQIYVLSFVYNGCLSKLQQTQTHKVVFIELAILIQQVYDRRLVSDGRTDVQTDPLIELWLKLKTMFLQMSIWAVWAFADSESVPVASIITFMM